MLPSLLTETWQTFQKIRPHLHKITFLDVKICVLININPLPSVKHERGKRNYALSGNQFCDMCLECLNSFVNAQHLTTTLSWDTNTEHSTKYSLFVRTRLWRWTIFRFVVSQLGLRLQQKSLLKDLMICVKLLHWLRTSPCRRNWQITALGLEQELS